MTKFSIITPVKNGMAFFEECIESILSQKGNFHIEYIVVDGKSTDGSYELICAYKKKLENKALKINCLGVEISVHSIEDQSMYEALSFGFNTCSGDIIAYLNADDMYLENAFSRVEVAFNSPNVNWLIGKIRTVNEKKELIHQLVPLVYTSELIQRGHYNGKYLPFIQQENVFFRKRCLEVLDLNMLAQFKLAGDFFMWSSFSKTYALWTCNQSFAQARMHDKRLSSNRNLYFNEFNKIALNKNIGSSARAFFLFIAQHVIPPKLFSYVSPRFISLP